jgi:hypothetical protein
MNPQLETSERQFQSAVIDMAKVFGWRVAHFHDSRRQVKPGVFVGDQAAAGFPDLVMVRRGDVVFAELKTEKGKVKAEQRSWLEALEEAHQRVHIWRPRDWSLIEEVLS